MSCDPLALAGRYIDRIKEIQAQTERTFSPIAGTLGELTQCLVFGTAERAGGILDPDALRQYDLDSLERRVNQIFDAVETGVDQVGNQVSRYSDSNTVNFAVATSGLWLSQDPANTFYGLVSARASKTTGEVPAIGPLVIVAQDAVREVRETLGDLTGPEGQQLRDAAQLYVDTICPEVSAIEQELRDYSDEVAETADLARSRCGIPTLEQRLRDLIEIVPQVGADKIIAALEAIRRMRVAVDDLETVRESLEVVQDAVPAFDEQFAAGGFTTQTEQRLPTALADQFAAICEQVAALAERDRWAEMVSLGPPLQEIAAVAITTLEQSPEWREARIQEHPAREAFEEYSETLQGTPRVNNGAEVMDRVEGSFAAAVIDLSDDFDQAVTDYEQYLADMAEYGQVIQSGAEAFLGLTSELIDQACVGALNRLLFEIGFDELEELYANGVFGDLPAAVYELTTTTGRLIQCVGDALNSTLRNAPIPAEQRFALERATDVLRVLEDADNRVAEIARELDGWLREPPLTNLTEISAALEAELLGGLRALGISIPGLPGTDLSADGFVSLIGEATGLPTGILTDTAGFLKAEAGALVPEGYTRLANGYLKGSTPSL